MRLSKTLFPSAPTRCTTCLLAAKVTQRKQFFCELQAFFDAHSFYSVGESFNNGLIDLQKLFVIIADVPHSACYMRFISIFVTTSTQSILQRGQSMTEKMVDIVDKYN